LNNEINTHDTSYLVDEEYELNLKTINDNIIEKRIDLTLPRLNQNQKTALANQLSPACDRIVNYLFGKQGERTDTINQMCAVGNLSDAVIGSKGAQKLALYNIGLRVTCDKVKAKNRYGQKCKIGIWWIEVIDKDKWIKAELTLYNSVLTKQKKAA
jgi:hypothetical protein